MDYAPLSIVVLMVLLCCVLVFSFVPNPAVHDVVINPDKYARLPDDLSPYCCAEIVDGKCTGKVDLDTAAFRVARGLNPSQKVPIDKSILRCD